MIVLLAIVSFTTAPPGSDHLLSAQHSAAGCNADLEKVKGAGRARFTLLGDLPDAHQEIAVNRMVGGCPAPVIVRYDVSR